MGKTLLISERKGGDWSLDLVFAGLVRKFGVDNVIDFPPQDRHREGKPVFIGDDEKDYGRERRSLCHVEGAHNLQMYSELQIMKLMKDGEIDRIFIDEREASYQVYCTLRAGLFNIPVVVVAGHDKFWNNMTTTRSYYGKNLEAMFIDDWQPQYDSLPNTHLINLSTNFDHLWNHENRDSLLADKRYDIFFMGYNSDPRRNEIISYITKRWWHLNNHILLETRDSVFTQFVRHDEYFSKMAQSKICINLAGASTCGRALRYYEIPYVGSYMLSQQFPAKLLHPYEDGIHCSYFKDSRDLDDKIYRALGDDKWRESVAAEGHHHSQMWHTVDARMQYIYQCLKERG